MGGVDEELFHNLYPEFVPDKAEARKRATKKAVKMPKGIVCEPINHYSLALVIARPLAIDVHRERVQVNGQPAVVVEVPVGPEPRIAQPDAHFPGLPSQARTVPRSMPRVRAATTSLAPSATASAVIAFAAAVTLASCRRAALNFLPIRPRLSWPLW
jgi:hypothetical protein